MSVTDTAPPPSPSATPAFAAEATRHRRRRGLRRRDRRDRRARRSRCRRTSSTSAPSRRRSRTARGAGRPPPARRRGRAGHDRRDREGRAVRHHRREGDGPGRAQRRPARLFKDGAPVVCEGRWSKGAAFDSDRILIKHGSEYKPPKVDTSRAQIVKASLGVLALALGASGALFGIGTLALGSAPAATTGSCRVGRRYVFVVLAAARARGGGHGVGAAHARLLDRVRRREQRPGHAAAVHDHRPVGRARGFDPAVGPHPRRLPRVRRAPVPRPRHRPARGVGDARRARRRAVLLRPDARAGQPVQDARRPSPLRRAGPEPAAAEPPADGVPPADALPRLRRASRSRSRSRSRRSSPAGSARAGWPTPAGRRSSPGASSPSASSSARGGATRCSAGAATGRGTRSRTRRCCRGSPRPRSSTR